MLGIAHCSYQSETKLKGSSFFLLLFPSMHVFMYNVCVASISFTLNPHGEVVTNFCVASIYDWYTGFCIL
jgi:hypothetical protein